MSQTQRFLCEAIELARANMEQGGRPFGAVIVRDGEVVLEQTDRHRVEHVPELRFARRQLGEGTQGQVPHACSRCGQAFHSPLESMGDIRIQAVENHGLRDSQLQAARKPGRAGERDREAGQHRVQAGTALHRMRNRARTVKAWRQRHAAL